MGVTMGAQVSLAQQQKIVNYLEIGQAEGAKVLTGGAANDVVSGGYYVRAHDGCSTPPAPLEPRGSLYGGRK